MFIKNGCGLKNKTFCKQTRFGEKNLEPCCRKNYYTNAY